jgi:hypothetical protein
LLAHIGSAGCKDLEAQREMFIAQVAHCRHQEPCNILIALQRQPITGEVMLGDPAFQILQDLFNGYHRFPLCLRRIVTQSSIAIVFALQNGGQRCVQRAGAQLNIGRFAVVHQIGKFTPLTCQTGTSLNTIPKRCMTEQQ